MTDLPDTLTRLRFYIFLHLQISTEYTLNDRIIKMPIFMDHGKFLDTQIRLLNFSYFETRPPKSQALLQIVITESPPTTKITFIISATFIVQLCFQNWYPLLTNPEGSGGLPCLDRRASIKILLFL